MEAMGCRKARHLTLLATTLISLRCGSPDIPASTLAQIRQAHLRNLTVDARIELRAGTLGPRALAPARMEKGGLDAAFFFIPVPLASASAEGKERAQAAAFDGLDRLLKAISDRTDRIGLGLRPDDAYRLEKQGRRTAFIGLAGGDAIGTDLALLAEIHRKGVRLLSLSDGSDNAICDSALDRGDPEDKGLSAFGRAVVAECNRLGLLIDVAGCSERSILDVLAASRAPVICSGAAARALSDVPGNLPDGTIRAIAAHGGVIAVTFDEARLLPPGTMRRAQVSDIADHIEYLMKLARPSGVGIGSGFGGGGGVRGCEDPSGMLNLTVELLRRGVSEQALEAIWGGNIMRVLEQAMAGDGDK
jgi:membrane dipeptidase